MIQREKRPPKLFSMMARLRSRIFPVVFIVAASAAAQPAEVDLSDLNKFTKSDFYYLLYRENVKFEIEKDQIITTTNTNKIFCYNNYKNTGYSSFDIVYNSAFAEIKNLEAISYVPEKGRYKKHEVQDFVTSAYSESSSFEDSYKQMTFTMPAIAQGTIGQIHYDEVNKEPHFSSAFYFKQYVPIAKNEFVVEADKDIEIAWKFIGDSTEIKFEKNVKGNKVTYKWSTDNLETIKREDYMPALNRITTQVVCWIKSANVNGHRKLINNDIHSFNSWISGLCTNAFQSPLSDQAKLYVDSLKKLYPSKYDLGRKIFEHVQKDIKYIAFENGMHGYIPRKPADVYYKRFGDCKDKATLLSSMLNFAGIESRTALVGTTSIVYKFSKFPIPECANHMITAVKLNGNWTITDATDEYVSYLSVPQSLQGQEALVLIDSASSYIYKIPVTPFYRNGRTDTLDIHISNMEIKGTGKTFFFGYVKQNVLAAIESYDQEKLKDFYKGLLNIGSNKCEYAEVTYRQVSDTALRIDYNVTLPSYITQFENKIYLNPHIFKTGIDDYGVDSSKKYSVRFKYSASTRHVLKINLEDLVLAHQPANSSVEKEKYGFSDRYIQKSDYLLFDSRYYENMMELSRPDFPDYEVYYAAFRKSILDNISFNKK